MVGGNKLVNHVHATPSTTSVQAIPFVSLIHEENRHPSSLIEQEIRSFPLSFENNLMNELNRLHSLMNRREMVHSFSVNLLKRLNNNDEEIGPMVKQLDEPRSQFIVKLREVSNESNEDASSKLDATIRDTEWIQSMVMKSGKPLGFSNVFAVVAKTSEIISHVSSLSSSNKAIDWIAEYEPRFKSALNFQKIQQFAEHQMHNLNELGENFTAANSLNDMDNHLIHVIITILPSLDAILVNQEVEEAHLIANELNSKLTEWLSKQQQQQWNNNNKNDHPSMISPIQVSSKDKLEMSFSPLVAQQVGDILKENSHVHFIERKHNFQLKNKKSSVLMQGFGPSPSVGMSATPFYDMGILGNGQIVAVADSGIDWDNCLFRDANNPIVKTNTVNMNHRKIVGYDTVTVGSISSDGQDEVDGHGTHVASSICGSIQNMTYNSKANPINEYHGMAPNARLYFTDLEKTGFSQILMPSSKRNSLFKPAYNSGARIFSYSLAVGPEDFFSCRYDCTDCKWTVSTNGHTAGEKVTDDTCRALFGSDSCCTIFNRYDSDCQEVDQIMWDYQDGVILLAQGNGGGMSSKGNIGSPSTAKNSIAVGASMTSNSAFEESVFYEDFKNRIQKTGLPFSTPDQCCSYNGEYQVIIRNFCCPSQMKTTYTSNPSIYNEFNLASFSSRGPAVGNRIKPDVTGIGYSVVSGHSDGNTNTNQCGTNSPSLGNSAALMTSQGTSMSTPLVAGAAALLREFFQTKMNISNPTGPLLKAALVHSSIPMTGTVAYSFDETRRFKLSELGTPNSYEGFGRVYLGSLLQNQDGTPLNILVQEQSFKNVSESLKLCFKRKDGNKAIQTSPFFKATLAWYDYPGSVSVVPQLLSDLDLFINTYVRSSSSSSDVSKLSVIAGNYGDRVDTTNNVERVVVEELPHPSSSSDHSVYVSVAVYVTKILKSNQQPFALLLTYPKDMLERVDPSDPSCFYTTDFPPLLSEEAIIGIVIGLLAIMLVVVVMAVVVVVVVKRRRSQKGTHVATGSHASSSYYTAR
ncbi:hypothetical protein FDP41_012663 [Naegleria fowleri]|uniref:Peptidase S8/S53 domain-containing protein n=1 Tax=Naegleria fowleri TaxID=5763 RepID=A0A6A5C5Y7_NAEFO|nr:uncharacterized protein FDP41_012663 [Naegleria fowleri]KAF0980875.1 hypothetical protein FDP41_012663 [Naegleria fowleri]